ncbi:MAG: hypothetical protein RLN89_08770, partial [Parvibaculum sp.]
TFHFRGHYFERGIDMAHAVRHAVGDETLKIKKLPWSMLRLMSPFVITIRELLDMRYLWQHTVALDNQKLVAFLGAEPHTNLNEALRATLAGLGCMRERPMEHTDPTMVGSLG